MPYDGPWHVGEMIAGEAMRAEKCALTKQKQRVQRPRTGNPPLRPGPTPVFLEVRCQDGPNRSGGESCLSTWDLRNVSLQALPCKRRRGEIARVTSARPLTRSPSLLGLAYRAMIVDVEQDALALAGRDTRPAVPVLPEIDLRVPHVL